METKNIRRWWGGLIVGVRGTDGAGDGGNEGRFEITRCHANAHSPHRHPPRRSPREADRVPPTSRYVKGVYRRDDAATANRGAGLDLPAGDNRSRKVLRARRSAVHT